MADIKTIHYGVGPIGASIVALMAKRGGFEFLGAIDTDPAKVGKDLGEVAGLNKKLGVTINKDADAVLMGAKANVVVHCTSSKLLDTFPQIARCTDVATSVISTCEELSYPIAQNRDLAEKLGVLAKESRVAILGTGVNPGFVMDTLAILLSGACQEVKRMRITRVVDAGQRRLPLQKKVGAGLSRAEFQQRLKEGTLRHVGLPESLAMVADTLGLAPDRVQEDVNPVIAEKPVQTPYLEVAPGQVAGVHQVCRGWRRKDEIISLELQMYVGATEPRDSVYIEGTPNIDMTIKGGIHGDLATAAIVVNAIPRLLEASPGFHTMKDLKLIHGVWR